MYYKWRAQDNFQGRHGCQELLVTLWRRRELTKQGRILCLHTHGSSHGIVNMHTIFFIGDMHTVSHKLDLLESLHALVQGHRLQPEAAHCRRHGWIVVQKIRRRQPGSIPIGVQRNSFTSRRRVTFQEKGSNGRQRHGEDQTSDLNQNASRWS